MHLSTFVYTCFFFSGISGLMYQVVWLRMLSRTTGVTIHATAIVIAAFMAGLAIGSILVGRVIDKRKDPLQVYSLLELLVGCTAWLVPYALSAAVPIYSHLYVTSQESLTVTALGTGLVSLFTLLVPTALMGGTLPVMTACLVKRKELFGKSLSMLYGINTLGAVMGVILSGFLTIGLWGERFTVNMAVFINFMVAALAYYRYRKDLREEPQAPPTERAETAISAISPYSHGIRQAVLFAFAVSGFTSLAYEVIWTRQLILFVENSIYAFAAMLAVFLTGISLGSMVLNRVSDSIINPLKYFGVLELAIGWISIGNLYLFPVLGNPELPFTNDWLLPFVAAAILVFPITFLFGMILPLAGRCYAESPEKTGSGVGTLYGFNTLGCIAGSLLAGFLLIPLLGSTKTIVILAAANAVVGLILIRLDSGASNYRWVALSACVLLGIVAFRTATVDPFLETISRKIDYMGSLVAAARSSQNAPLTRIILNREAIEGTVTAFQVKDLKHLWINGIGMTHLCTETKLMAHLPLLWSDNPREFLVVCFGMGTTVKSAALYGELRITAVELVREIFGLYPFYHPNSEPLNKNPNIRLVANDGRNHLLLSPRKYDVITVDPPPPVWSARTVNLYTLEFFRLCKSRLKDGGVMCLWFPGAPEDENISLIKTFTEVFPYRSVWWGPHRWGLYLIGSADSIPWDKIEKRIDEMFRHPEIVADLREYDKSCDTPEKLRSMLRLGPKQLLSLQDDTSVPIITDNHPYTEFYLWRRYFSR